MTNPTRRALRSSAEDVRRPAEQGLTRRQLREQQRAAESIALTASEARAAERVMVVEGSAPLYTTRRAMREAATRVAHELPVQIAEPTFTEPLITVDAPSLGNGGDQVPGVRQPRALAPRVVRQTVAIAPPPRRTSSLRGIARKITAGGALLFIGSLVVVTSLPAQAVQSPEELSAEIAQIDAGQQTLAGNEADSTSYFSRDDIVVTDEIAEARMSAGELAAFQAVADAEPTGASYGGDPAFPRTWSMLQTSVAQSPFPSLAQLPVSSGFGNRPGGFHGGTDIPLPLGTEIRPIANGVVSAVWQGNNPGGGGYVVFIDHNIDGQFVQSWYAHMLPGSIQVEVGQVVDITTVVGQVGSSGRSTGPHLHLELKNREYVSFDPMLWLQTREMDLEYRGY